MDNRVTTVYGANSTSALVSVCENLRGLRNVVARIIAKFLKSAPAGVRRAHSSTARTSYLRPRQTVNPSSPRMKMRKIEIARMGASGERVPPPPIYEWREYPRGGYLVTILRPRIP